MEHCLERRNKDTALLTDKSYHHAYYHIVSRYKCIRLISLYREIGAMLIGVGFLCAGLAVLKKLISNHERTKEAIITYITALVTWLIIWQLL